MRASTLIVCVVVARSVAFADAPLPPPAHHEQISPSKTIIAISDPMHGTTVLRARDRKLLWSEPQWHRWLFVSDDGQHLVSTEVANLIPIAYTDDLVLFVCWRNGREIGNVRLADVVPDKAILQRTVSHYFWGWIEQLTKDNDVVVRRADGEYLHFDAATCRSRAEHHHPADARKDARR